MWVYNEDFRKWQKNVGGLNIDEFQLLSQELESVRFYSKCLSGSSFITTNDLDNIYDFSTDRLKKSWFISTSGSQYSVTSIPTDSPSPINLETGDDFYNKNLPEYGFTLKNLFTGDRIFKDGLKNLNYVDLATNSAIDGLNTINIGRVIDGVRLINGHRVLVKDQVSRVILPNSVDPDSYFTGQWEIINNYVTDVEYQFYNEENGIYKYIDGLLVRESDLNDYSKCIKFSVYVKLGEINSGRQYNLTRLSNGYFPTTSLNQPINFIENRNWILRNRVDYNNLYDLNLYSIYAHGTQSYTYGGLTWSIPPRTISVGEFGSIIINQSGISNIIKNKYKNTLRSIAETSVYYWIVGDSGLLLRVRKHDLYIDSIIVDCLCPNGKVITNLQSISFLDELNAVAVGDMNTILITTDGGVNWKREKIEAFNAYYFNKVIYKDKTNFYIVGNNGVFINFKLESNSKWVAYKRRISKFIDSEDEFLLVDNINDIISTNITSWGLSNPYGLTPSVSKDLLILVTDSNGIIIHDVDDSIPLYTDFLYLDMPNDYGDIGRLMREAGTNNFYFTGFTATQSGIFKFDISDFSLVSGSDNNIITGTGININNISVNYPNAMFDYSGAFLICGNNSQLLSGDYTSYSFSELDQTFSDRFKSKLLFLDYDIASKLNFFTDDGDYILPNSIDFQINDINNLFISFDSLTQSEVNWWKYWADSQSTFEYYSDSNQMTDSKKVYPSATFSYGDLSELVVTSITNNVSDIEMLAPTILEPDHSRFNGFGLTAISIPTSNHQLYLYNYLMVIKYDSSEFYLEVGDVIRLESQVVDWNFIVNRIVNSGSTNLAYVFTEFNDNIIRSMISSGVVTIKNLNKFESESDLVDKFNIHPISSGYSLSIEDSEVTIMSKFNNETAYYNLSCLVYSDSPTPFEMSYSQSFLKFGYTPYYNILDYLKSIDGIKFSDDKEYLSMPIYSGIPISPTGLDVSSVYLDINYPSNRILMGENLKLEWDSIFINTFVDIVLNDGVSDYKTERLLVLDKYKIENIDGLGFDAFVIEFHKIIRVAPSLQTIDIISRRKLSEIGEDLKLLNNIGRPINEISYTAGESIIWDVEFKTYEKYLNFKPNTDSYAKILLSDSITSREITGVIYTDYKGELSLNIANLEVDKTIPIINTSDYGGNLSIICQIDHGLSTGDGVVLEFNGGTGSSEYLNREYFGYCVVYVIDQNSFYTEIPYGMVPTVGNDTGFVKYVKRDPLFNYSPVDIIGVSSDGISNKSIELSPQNLILSGDSYSLVDINFDNYRIRLVDGISFDVLAKSWSWIYEAEISGAIIGFDEFGLVWYSGTWECGRWFGGTWISGTWISGDWYSGTWKSNKIIDNYINVLVGQNLSDPGNSSWLSGRWFGGEWGNGTWVSGRWYDGVWNGGIWYDGIWNDGIWNSGQFTGGIWVDGIWNGGNFIAKNAPAYWINGTWNGGDFENGMWFNGIFDSKNLESRFGTKSYNSRSAIWHSGKWINGSFHSRLNINESGEYDVSESHKQSIWYTGQWFAGDFYGGIAFNIDFKSGTWHGGISEDIKIIGMSGSNINSENYFTLKGIYRFNTGDQITIIDNDSGGIYSQYGNNLSPGVYNVLNTIIDESLGITNVYVDRVINALVAQPSDIGIRVVSRFKNCNWKSGVWFNGVYNRGSWEGGIWYNGVFNGIWM